MRGGVSSRLDGHLVPVSVLHRLSIVNVIVAGKGALLGCDLVREGSPMMARAEGIGVVSLSVEWRAHLLSLLPLLRHLDGELAGFGATFERR